MNHPEPDYSRHDSYQCFESRLVWDYFHRQTSGVFVDVGANHPTEQSQTWFLEQQGWSGVLVEPNPELAKLLREQRPRAKTFQVACGSPARTGRVELHLAVGHGQSAIQPDFTTELTGEVVGVDLRTLNSVIEEAGFKTIDFLSLDVEGMEVEVLRGLDLGRYEPKLLLIEDHVYDYEKHRYLRGHRYKLVRRTGYNNWYVPETSATSVCSLCSTRELWNLVRKMYLSYPFIRLKRALKKARLAPLNRSGGRIRS